MTIPYKHLETSDQGWGALHQMLWGDLPALKAVTLVAIHPVIDG
jgi:hypothetical protein